MTIKDFKPRTEILSPAQKIVVLNRDSITPVVHSGPTLISEISHLSSLQILINF